MCVDAGGNGNDNAAVSPANISDVPARTVQVIIVLLLYSRLCFLPSLSQPELHMMHSSRVGIQPVQCASVFQGFLHC